MDQAVTTIQELQKATMSPQVIKSSGAGKAYQSVAQSTAIAVQDATDFLRNVSTISSTAIGVAMAQLLADPTNTASQIVIQQAQEIVANASTNFESIGSNAASVLNQFPTS